MMEDIVNLSLLMLFTFLLNLPFGMWRERSRKFSWQWVVGIHGPIPLIVAMRFGLQLGFQLYTFPFVVGSFFAGQWVGSRVQRNIHLH